MGAEKRQQHSAFVEKQQFSSALAYYFFFFSFYFSSLPDIYQYLDCFCHSILFESRWVTLLRGWSDALRPSFYHSIFRSAGSVQFVQFVQFQRSDLFVVFIVGKTKKYYYLSCWTWKREVLESCVLQMCTTPSQQVYQYTAQRVKRKKSDFQNKPLIVRLVVSIERNDGIFWKHLVSPQHGSFHSQSFWLIHTFFTCKSLYAVFCILYVSNSCEGNLIMKCVLHCSCGAL